MSVPLEFDGSIFTPTPQRILSLADIPDIATMDIPPVEYLVPAFGIARNTITLWTGPDGDGKTYLAQVMALSVARGEEFLGMRCQQAPVLYVDLENPGYVVQDRIQALVDNGNCPSDLRFWGTWLDFDQQPPHAGSELLLTICKDSKPLLIVDPFRYFHKAEENDSTEMSGVMQYLRACAAYGAAVVILHHPAKTEGSTGRGSSAIRGACDLAFLHTLDKESGLVTLKVDKNRLGQSARALRCKVISPQGLHPTQPSTHRHSHTPANDDACHTSAEEKGTGFNGLRRVEPPQGVCDPARTSQLHTDENSMAFGANRLQTQQLTGM